MITSGLRQKRILLPMLILSVILLAMSIKNPRISFPEINVNNNIIGYSGIAVSLIIIYFVFSSLFKDLNRTRKLGLQLHLQKEHLATILDSIGDGLITTGKSGEIHYMNPAAERLTGWSIRDARNRHIDDVYHVENEETGRRFENVIARIFKERRTIQTENNTVLNRRDAVKLVVSNSGSPLLDSKGNLKGAVLVFNDITAKKKTENQLIESEKQYRNLIEQASDGIVIYSFDGTIYDFNEAVYKLTGYTSEEFKQLTLADLLFNEPVVLNTANAENIAAGKTVLFTRRLKKKDGCAIEAEINARSMPDGRILAFVRDISERKKAEEELRRLSLIARETTNAVIVTDKEQKIQWVNDAFTRVTGFAQEEIVGKTPGSFLQGPGTDASTVNFMRQKIQACQSFECDIINYTNGGSPYWVRIQCQPLFDNNGNHIGFFSLQTDITKEKESELELKSSEERYRELFNNNPSCIYLWDLDTLQILEVNDTAISQYGYSKAAFCKLTLLDLRLREDHKEIIEYAERTRTNQNTSTVSTWKHINRKGQVMYMNIASHKISYNGKIAMMAMANDVTEKILLREKLEKERLVKQQEITKAVISAQENERKEIGRELHDNINQLLASARLYLGMVKSNQNDSTGFLKEADNLMLSAIEEIRTLSHSLIPPAIGESALTEALDEIVKTIRQTTKIKVDKQFADFDETSIHPNLKLAIYRITQEQFNNIIKYSKAENITFKLCRESGKIILHIKDDGAGFDPSSKPGGVGLMNMKTRASLFNGKMNIISSPGQGCELNIIFEPDLNGSTASSKAD